MIIYNVFNRYLSHDDHFGPINSDSFVKYDVSDSKSNNIIYLLCDVVSKLDFMIIISLRATSKWNKHQR
jgi:hypothetical protein